MTLYHYGIRGVVKQLLSVRSLTDNNLFTLII